MKVSRSALLPFSASDMYAVVADIGAYPEFLNWCESVELHSEQDDEVIASLAISYSKLKFTFTTCNTNTLNESIELKLRDGPFKKLEGRWQFLALSESACKVSLEMEFDFDNPLAKRALSGMFKNIISAQIDAFQKRAESLKG